LRSAPTIKGRLRIGVVIIHSSSMPSYSSILLDSIVLGVLLFVIKAYVQKWRNSAGLLYPPGPPGYPVIGNILDIPKEAPWEQYVEWAKQYGALCTR